MTLGSAHSGNSPESAPAANPEAEAKTLDHALLSTDPSRRLPPGDHRRPGRPRRPARRRAALRTLLADLSELAPLRHPAQARPARPSPGRLQGQSPPPRIPRQRRTPRPGLCKWSGKTLADDATLTATGASNGSTAGRAWLAVTPGLKISATLCEQEQEEECPEAEQEGPQRIPRSCGPQRGRAASSCRPGRPVVLP